jgi:predicted pyridoxine 5'-phosphate oxidase superfamily flavin-nucleotide-binding protein
MNYAKLAFTDPVKKLQEAYGSRKQYERVEQARDVAGLSENEIFFVSERDGFYLSTTGENGYPYIQFRGGPAGFLKVIDPTTLGFLDFWGNLQYISTGNMQTNRKVALFFMDYARQTRLKMFAEAEILALEDRPDLVEELQLPNYKAKPERIILLHIKGYDWNCPQHITPRYTVKEIEEAMAPQKAYIAQLEKELAELKGKD